MEEFKSPTKGAKKCQKFGVKLHGEGLVQTRAERLKRSEVSGEGSSMAGLPKYVNRGGGGERGNRGKGGGASQPVTVGSKRKSALGYCFGDGGLESRGQVKKRVAGRGGRSGRDKNSKEALATRV